MRMYITRVKRKLLATQCNIRAEFQPTHQSPIVSERIDLIDQLVVNCEG